MSYGWPVRPSLVVDLADVSTWPGEAETVLRGKADSDDPEGDDDDLEKSLRAALAGRSILAYHGTRLLPAEAAAVRQVGLRVLTNDLRQTKLQSAGVYLSVDEVPLVRRAMEPWAIPDSTSLLPWLALIPLG